jgi:hypothetical protein
MLLLSSLTHQILQFRKLIFRCLSVWLGLFFIAVYVIMMMLSVNKLLFMYPCQSLVFCALVWHVGAWMRVPAIHLVSQVGMVGAGEKELA